MAKITNNNTKEINSLTTNMAVVVTKIEAIKENVIDIKNKMECMVPNDSEYKELKLKVDSLWDSKNKLVGWMLGAGIAGGGVSALLSGAVKTVLALMK